MKARYDSTHKPISLKEGSQVYLRLHGGYKIPGLDNRKAFQALAVRARLPNYESDIVVSHHVGKASEDDGSTIVQKALIVPSPIPTADNILKFRTTFVAVEAALTCIFGALVNFIHLTNLFPSSPLILNILCSQPQKNPSPFSRNKRQ